MQLESLTRTSSMFLEAMMAQAHQRQQSSLAIDGGVEYGPDLPEAVLQHAITLHYLNSVTPVWRIDKCQLLLSPNMVH